jgi:Tfp pilus assembly protein PilO
MAFSKLVTNMISSKRVRWLVVTLAAAIIGGVVVDGGMPSLAGRNVRPSNERERLSARLRSLRQDWERIEIAQARLAAAGSTSLPPDPEVAASLWQSAILGEAREVELNEVTVTPVTSRPEGALVHRVALEVRTTGTSVQLGAFVDRVLALPPQTRIDSLSLTPTSSPSGSDGDRLRLDLTVEALSLSGAEPRHELVAGASSPRTVSPPKNEFGSLLPAVDLFPRIQKASPAETSGESPEQEGQTPSRPALAELLAGTRMLAAWHGGAVSEVWFHETPGNIRHTLRPGQSFTLGESAVRLVSIGHGVCSVEVDGAVHSIRLGETLGDGLVQ